MEQGLAVVALKKLHSLKHNKEELCQKLILNKIRKEMRNNAFY